MKVRSIAQVVGLIGTLLLAGCDAYGSKEPGAQKADDDPPAPVVTTEALKPSQAAGKIDGFATVLNADALLQLDADIRSQTVAADFSRGQLSRFQSSTSLSKQMVETATRQAGIDASQLKLLLARLQQTWGDEAPFLSTEARQNLIAEIGNGSRAIVRLDFPDLASGQPKNVRVVPLRGGKETPVDVLWPAPSGNAAMPGVSFFGIIPAGPGLRTGDRARLVADNPQSEPGLIIPSSAIVVFAGTSWCYVETAPNKYERQKVSLDSPIDDGYLVRTGYTAGTKVVTRGASNLLAREAQASGAGADDDDDAPAKTKAPAAAPPPSKPGPSASVLPDHKGDAKDAD